jgi:LacI family transcriptional regulator
MSVRICGHNIMQEKDTAMTNKEIAQALHISPAAVSMALNGKGGVSEETKKKIFELKGAALRENMMEIHRRELLPELDLVVYQHTGQIIAGAPFLTSLMTSVAQWTQVNSYDSRTVMANQENLQEQLEKLQRSDSSGVLWLATEMHPEEAAKVKEMIEKPVVFLDAAYPGMGVDAVLMDNAGGIRMALDYGKSMGHSRIGFIGSKVYTPNFWERLQQYRILRQAGEEGLGLAKKAAVEILSLTPDVTQAGEEIKEALSTRPPEDLPTLYLAANDKLAIGAMRGMQEMGIAIPEQVSVIGFDDMPMAELVHPALTTLRLKENEIARLAVERLIYKMSSSGKEGAVTQLMEVELVIRDSVRRIS